MKMKISARESFIKSNKKELLKDGRKLLMIIGLLLTIFCIISNTFCHKITIDSKNAASKEKDIVIISILYRFWRTTSSM